MKLTAQLFRRKVGSDLEGTARRLTETLTQGGIPCVIVGGYALQEHGYHRSTLDVDVVVSSIDAAQQYLAIRGFKPTGAKSILYDRATGVEVNLLPAGGQATLASPLPIPSVTTVGAMQILPLLDLIEMKLNVYVGNTTRYIKHRADVMELIKANGMRLEQFKSSNECIQTCWEETWAAVNAIDDSPEWMR